MSDYYQRWRVRCTACGWHGSRQSRDEEARYGVCSGCGLATLQVSTVQADQQAAHAREDFQYYAVWDGQR